MSAETANWINQKYLDWQKTNGRAPFKDFADYLGVSRDTLNSWTGKKRRTPEGDSLKLLGEKLGWEIYDVVGEPRPDPRLQAIIQNWGALSEEKKAKLYAEAERMAALGTEEPAVAAPKRRSKN